MNFGFVGRVLAREPQALWRLAAHAPNLIRLYWRLLMDPRVGWWAKGVLLAGVVYFVFPLDLIPDFPLIGLGWTDDLIVMALCAHFFVRLCPPRVVQEHVRLLDEGS